MKNDTFYQLLNRELPRAINGANRLLGSVEKNSGSFWTEGRGGSALSDSDISSENRDPALMDVYPTLSNRSSSLSPDCKCPSLTTIRDMLGQLSLAYAISNYDRFAEVADGWLLEDMLSSEMVASQEWEESFSLKRSGNGTNNYIAMIEVVLGFELLRAWNRIEDQHLRDLRSQLAERLANLTRRSVESWDQEHQFAWLLEQLTIALFLRDYEAIEKVGYSVKAKYHDLFLSFLKGVETVEKGEYVQAIDCYFALCFWLDQAQVMHGGFVKTAFDHLCDRFNNPGLIDISRGIWVTSNSTPLLDDILRNSSVLLFVGEGLGRTDLIDCWFEGEEKAPEEATASNGLLTRPLLWFGSEDWNYRPFRRTGQSFNAIRSRN